MTQTASLLHRITQNPGQCGARPCIRGMRIRVSDILEMLAENVNAAEILEDFPDLEKTSRLVCCLQRGNVTHRNLRQILSATFPDALQRLRQGEAIIEISDRP